MLASQLETLLNPEENLPGSEVRYITDKVSWEYYETLLTQLGDSLEFRFNLFRWNFRSYVTQSQP
jgi:hypothetical protein